MALRVQLGRPDLADMIDRAVSEALNDGLLTRDLRAGAEHRVVGTVDMGIALIDRLAM